MESTREESQFTTPSDREAVLTRVLDAPREQVFRTLLDSGLIHEWWGPRRLSVRVDRMEVRVGREWRFVLRDAAGKVFAFRGVFQEISPPERVAYSLEYEDLPGHSVLVTAELDDLGGKTRVRFAGLFGAQGDRDAALAQGVGDGALEAADRFAEVLNRCAARPPAQRDAAKAADEAGAGRDPRPS